MKICALFNIAPGYRLPIYRLMDQELDVDFLFGDIPAENIALMNPQILNGFRGFTHNIYRGNKLVWQRGAIRKALCRRYKAYILTGNTGILSNWIIVLSARMLGRKVYLWTHGLYGGEHGFELFKNRLYLRLATGILCYNEHGAQVTIRAGVSSDKVHVIYNSLDYDAQCKALKNTGDNAFIRNYFGNSNPTICYVGRLTKVKQLELLINAAAMGDYNVIIVGDGPEFSTLQTAIEHYALTDRVWLYGECYDQQMLATIITNCQAVVSPGNAGLNVIHALTCGTPLITHENMKQQMPETEAVLQLQKKSGVKMLFRQNDPYDLNQTILNIINLGPEQKQHITDLARKIIADKWNPKKQIQILRNLGM